jgi:hypothetical protein
VALPALHRMSPDEAVADFAAAYARQNENDYKGTGARGSARKGTVN